jgi:hypothetical protein
VSRLKFRRPTPALLVATVALFVALGGGGALAATKLMIHTGNIANGAVTNHKLANGAVGLQKLNTHVRSALSKIGGRGIVGTQGPQGAQGPQGQAGPAGPAGATGAQGPQGQTGPQGQPGPQGQAGTNGTDGQDGQDGLNPAVAVDNIPAVTASGGATDPSNPAKNPDSGAPGDQGWYFTGLDSSGHSASLTDGGLELQGVGVDGPTTQGGIGVGKAFTNMPLSNLTALAYDWTVDTTNGGQAPCVHVSVTGLNADSHFGSGFANLVLNPFLNGQTALAGVQFHTDGFTAGAKWYSTTQPNISDPGGQNKPQAMSFFTTNNPNATITQISLDNCGTSNAAPASFDAIADGLLINGTRYDFGS